MAQAKATTIQQRFGFQDHELTTPIHDEIMMWLDESMEEVVAGIANEKDDFERVYSEVRWRMTSRGGEVPAQVKDVYDTDEKINALARALLNKYPPPDVKHKIDSKLWEATVADGKYIIGFIDMRVNAAIFSPTLKWERVAASNDSLCKWREPVDGPPPPPFDDGSGFSYKLSLSWGAWGETFLFEVKPSIKSLGEVIRQVRMYQKYEREGRYFIVCPDARFQEKLREQGIGFVKYPLQNR